MTQILNFGLPAPIDMQIDGADVEGNRAVADQDAAADLRTFPALIDLRIQQPFDYPKFHVARRPHQSRSRAATRSTMSPAACWYR